MMEQIRAIHPNVRFSFMAAPNWVPKGPGVDILRQGEVSVPWFLKRGNLFWYPLPLDPPYTDQGPRVIVEALAFGLPVIADNRDGAKDRVTDEVGWLCDTHEQYLDVLQGINGKVLNIKGQAAKEYARTAFDPMRWIGHITTP
jgi:glycosyltransferase involved in cell wall biosynthesis